MEDLELVDPVLLGLQSLVLVVLVAMLAAVTQQVVMMATLGRRPLRIL